MTAHNAVNAVNAVNVLTKNETKMQDMTTDPMESSV